MPHFGFQTSPNSFGHAFKGDLLGEIVRYPSCPWWVHCMVGFMYHGMSVYHNPYIGEGHSLESLVEFVVPWSNLVQQVVWKGYSIQWLAQCSTMPFGYFQVCLSYLSSPFKGSKSYFVTFCCLIGLKSKLWPNYLALTTSSTWIAWIHYLLNPPMT